MRLASILVIATSLMLFALPNYQSFSGNDTLVCATASVMFLIGVTILLSKKIRANFANKYFNLFMILFCILLLIADIVMFLTNEISLLPATLTGIAMASFVVSFVLNQRKTFKDSHSKLN